MLSLEELEQYSAVTFELVLLLQLEPTKLKQIEYKTRVVMIHIFTFTTAT